MERKSFFSVNWADWAETKRSWELIARYVMPKVQELNVNREASYQWVGDNAERFMAQARMAVGVRIAQHIQEKGVDNIQPEILAAMGMGPKAE